MELVCFTLFTAGEGCWVPLKTGNGHTKLSLLFSLGSGEFSNTSITAAWHLPRKQGPQLPITMGSASSRCCQQSTSAFLPAHRRETACPATTQSLHQHPGTTDSFWTKIVFPRFCFFPAPSCFVCLGRGFVFLNCEGLLLCCFLCSLSQPHGLEQGPLCHLVLVLWPMRAAWTAAILFSFFLRGPGNPAALYLLGFAAFF